MAENLLSDKNIFQDLVQKILDKVMLENPIDAEAFHYDLLTYGVAAHKVECDNAGSIKITRISPDELNSNSENTSSGA